MAEKIGSCQEKNKNGGKEQEAVFEEPLGRFHVDALAFHLPCRQRDSAVLPQGWLETPGSSTPFQGV